MTTYTVIALADGRRIGGQSNATMKDVVDLVHDERGIDYVFLRSLVLKGHAMSFERYKVFPSDERETVSCLVVYQNQ